MYVFCIINIEVMLSGEPIAMQSDLIKEIHVVTYEIQSQTAIYSGKL